MAALSFDSPATRWLHAASRVVDWLEPRLGEKGRLQEELHDLGSYYKWPLFLWSLGRVDLAEQLFHVIVVDFMTADGDFRTGEGELLTDLEIPERLQRIYLDRPDQAYVYLGMSAVFLARLFAVAGEERFLGIESTGGSAAVRPDGRRRLCIV